MENRLCKSLGLGDCGGKDLAMEKGEMLANAMNMIASPCTYCRYNGEGYYQPHTHEPYCRWYTVGGQFERAKIVMSEMIRYDAQKLPMIVCSEDAIIGRVVKILPSDAVISVTSPDGIHPTILKEHQTIISLKFYDINPYLAWSQKKHEALLPYEHGLMQDTHATQIIEFVDSLENNYHITRLVIHCEAGVSRSPGIALALSIIYGFQPTSHELYKTHTAYNEYVTMKLLNAWRLREGKKLVNELWRP
jgi:predicted protein tyrosine phosphatase